MRSNWPLERVLAVLAAAVFEGAWLTLAYLLIQWLAGNRGVHLDVLTMSGAALFGLLLARAVRDWPRGRYAAALVGSTLIVAAIGLLAIGVPPAQPGNAPPIFGAHPGGWLLGPAVWRGTLHAELGDEAELSETMLRGGVFGLIGFWLVATSTRMVGQAEYTAPAFVATLVFVGAGLLSLGLARLAELEIEQMDRAARRRWVTLLLAVSGLVLVLAVPVAALLGVPVASTVEALAGPLAPLVLQLVLLLLIPFSLLAELLSAVFGAILGPRRDGPLPTPFPDATAGPQPGQELPPGVLDLSWLGIVALVATVAVALMVMAALARPPGALRRARALDEERAAEPVSLDLTIRLPRLRLPRLRSPAPTDAATAYRAAVAALDPTADARLPTETPREHAARVAGHGADLRRLAADYQLVAFGGSALNAAEERRAIERWRRIVSRVRRLPRRSPAAEG